MVTSPLIIEGLLTRKWTCASGGRRRTPDLLHVMGSGTVRQHSVDLVGGAKITEGAFGTEPVRLTN